MDEQHEVDTLGAAPGGGAEGSVISESQFVAGRALFERGLRREVNARELGLDVRTVRKWLRQRYSPHRRQAGGRLLDRFWAFVRARALRAARRSGRCGSRRVRASRRRWTGA